MSIWSSVPSEIVALDGHGDAANYRAEGDPTITVDVATTGAHDHIRLALWNENGHVDVCAVLAPSAARGLRKALDEALMRVERP